MKWSLFIIFLLLSCSGEKDTKKRIKSDYIYRRSNSYLFPIKRPEVLKKERYPWERGKPLKIGEYFFRCNGRATNPPISKDDHLFSDCNCSKRKSCIVDRVLIDLLNYLQDIFKKRVFIISGYRCKRHDSYLLLSKKNSKHYLGKAVDFYIEGGVEIGRFIKGVEEFYKRKKDCSEFRKRGDSFSNGWVSFKFLKGEEENSHIYLEVLDLLK